MTSRRNPRPGAQVATRMTIQQSFGFSTNRWCARWQAFLHPFNGEKKRLLRARWESWLQQSTPAQRSSPPTAPSRKTVLIWAMIWPRKHVQAVAQLWLLLDKCKGLVTLSSFLLFCDILVCFNPITIRCAQGRNPGRVGRGQWQV